MAMDDYQRGFADGWVAAINHASASLQYERSPEGKSPTLYKAMASTREKKRKLSAWQKFVKTNSKKPRFKYKTGKRKGMVNMKALAAAWKRKKKR